MVAFINEKNEIELNILHFYIPKIDSHNSNALSLKDTENLSGLLSFYDLKNHILDVSSYKNGKELIKNYAVKNVDRNINELNPRIQSEDEVCETFVEEWAVVSYYYWTYTDGTIEVISTDIEYFSREYSSCDGDGESGGGNSGSSEIVIEIPVEILNKLTNECAFKIFEQLRSGLYKIDPNKPHVVTPNGNLNLSENILLLFSESYKTNYTIQNGTTSGSNASTERGVTTMNDNYLLTATKLSIARTMIHEQLHAYLDAVFFRRPDLRDSSLEKKLKEYAKFNGINDIGTLHHEFMINYVDVMAYSLYEWDVEHGNGHGHLGWDYYKAMAYGGLVNPVKDVNGDFVYDTNGYKTYEDTNSFIDLIPNETDRNNIKKINIDEAKGEQDAKGEKCTS